MKKEDYNISITGRQSFGTESGEINLRTTGTYSRRGNARFISYQEYEEDNPSKVHTSVLKVEENRVTLMRENSETKLILEKGKRHLCLYDTGIGQLNLGIFTNTLESALHDTGGYLSIKYTLDIDSNLSSNNEIHIEIKPRRLKKPPVDKI